MIDNSYCPIHQENACIIFVLVGSQSVHPVGGQPTKTVVQRDHLYKISVFSIDGLFINHIYS